MKLNEIFTEWKTGGGIFSLMVSPPWKDSITGLELDIEYFTNQSGTKQPSLLLLNFIEDNKISQNDVFCFFVFSQEFFVIAGVGFLGGSVVQTGSVGEGENVLQDLFHQYMLLFGGMMIGCEVF